MSKYALAYVQAMERVNRRLALGVRWLVLALVAIFIYEAFARYVLNMPPKWSIELGAFFLGVIFLIGGGYALLTEGHVRMDAFYDKWSPRTRAIVDLITFPLLAAYVSAVIWGGIQHTIAAIETGKHTASSWAPPLWPVAVIIAIGATLLLLQAIALFIRDLLIVRGKST